MDVVWVVATVVNFLLIFFAVSAWGYGGHRIDHIKTLEEETGCGLDQRAIRKWRFFKVIVALSLVTAMWGIPLLMNDGLFLLIYTYIILAPFFAWGLLDIYFCEKLDPHLLVRKWNLEDIKKSSFPYDRPDSYFKGKIKEENRVIRKLRSVQVVTVVLAFTVFLFMPTMAIDLVRPLEGGSSIPEPYYFNEGYVEPTLGNLDDVVNEIIYPHEYEEGVYDCSERSAYVERYLENRGFDASIVSSDNKQHAWVLVRDVKCTATYHMLEGELYKTPWYVYDDDLFEGSHHNTVVVTTNIYVETGMDYPFVIDPSLLKVGLYEVDYKRYSVCYENIYEATLNGTFTSPYDWWEIHQDMQKGVAT